MKRWNNDRWMPEKNRWNKRQMEGWMAERLRELEECMDEEMA